MELTLIVMLTLLGLHVGLKWAYDAFDWLAMGRYAVPVRERHIASHPFNK